MPFFPPKRGVEFNLNPPKRGVEFNLMNQHPSFIHHRRRRRRRRRRQKQTTHRFSTILRTINKYISISKTMSSQSRELLHLYRQLLRSCATYPSKNRWRIYRSIQDEFRENKSLNPDDSRTQQQIQVAFKGLSQLQMYDPIRLSRGNPENPNWEVTLEQNPMPKPPE